MVTENYSEVGEGLQRVEQMILGAVKGIHEGAKEITTLQKRNLQIAMMAKKLIYSGDTIRSINTNHPSDDRYTTEILSTAFAIDSMEPHKVKLSEDRKIYSWALRKGNEHVKAIARIHGSMWVHKHPFLEEASDRTLSKIPDILNRNIEFAIRNS